MIKTEEVDALKTEKCSRTQAKQDNGVQEILMEARSRLALELAGEESTFQLFKQRLKEENWVAAMKVLGELGQRNSPPSSYWRELEWVAFLLRHDEGQVYRAKAVELIGEEGKEKQVS